jgi:malate synthase
MSQPSRLLEVDASKFQESRNRRQHDVNAGVWPAFSAQIEAIGQSDWQVVAPDGEQQSQRLLRGVESSEEALSLVEHLVAGEEQVVLRVDSVWCAIDLEGIVHALRGFVAALDCDFDAYLYSFICTFQRYPQCILPDRSDMTANTHCLSALARHVISIGSRRGVGVQGDGVHDQLPADPVGPPVQAADLIQVPRGRITRRGIRRNIREVLGSGASTVAVKLACAQLWQWVRHETGVLDEGQIVTAELFDELLCEQVSALGDDIAATSRSRVLRNIVLGESFTMQSF